MIAPAYLPGVSTTAPWNRYRGQVPPPWPPGCACFGYRVVDDAGEDRSVLFFLVCVYAPPPFPFLSVRTDARVRVRTWDPQSPYTNTQHTSPQTDQHELTSLTKVKPEYMTRPAPGSQNPLPPPAPPSWAPPPPPMSIPGMSWSIPGMFGSMVRLCVCDGGM